MAPSRMSTAPQFWLSQIGAGRCRLKRTLATAKLALVFAVVCLAGATSCAGDPEAGGLIDALEVMKPRGIRYWTDSVLRVPLAARERGLRMLLGAGGSSPTISSDEARRRLEEASVVLMTDIHELSLCREACRRLMEWSLAGMRGRNVLLLECAPPESQPLLDSVMAKRPSLRSLDSVLHDYWGRSMPGYDELVHRLAQHAGDLNVRSAGLSRRENKTSCNSPDDFMRLRIAVDDLIWRAARIARAESEGSRIWILVGEWHLLDRPALRNRLAAAGERVVTVCTLDPDWELASRRRSDQGWFEPLPNLLYMNWFSDDELKLYARGRMVAADGLDRHLNGLVRLVAESEGARRVQALEEIAALARRSSAARRALLDVAQSGALRERAIHLVAECVPFWDSECIAFLQGVAEGASEAWPSRVAAAYGLAASLAVPDTVIPILLRAMEREYGGITRRRQMAYLLGCYGALAASARERLGGIQDMRGIAEEVRLAIRNIETPMEFRRR